jgi:hypothetical protein
MPKYLYYLMPSLFGLLLPLTAFNPFNSGKTALMNISLSKGVNFLNGQKTNQSTNDKPAQERTSTYDPNHGINGEKANMDSERIRSVSDATLNQYQFNQRVTTHQTDNQIVEVSANSIIADVVCFSNYRLMNLRSSPKLLTTNILAVIPCDETVELIDHTVYHNDDVDWYFVTYKNKTGYIAKGGLNVR